MKVHELIAKLLDAPAEATVEFEIPHSKPADREPLDGARVMVTGVEETFYNEPSNKYVILS